LSKPFVAVAVEAPGSDAARLPGGRERAAGAAVESLLARASRITEVSQADVDQACRALGVDSPSGVRNEFKSLYGRFLDHCFEDRRLSIEESEDLEHLQRILGLGDSDVGGVQDEAAIRVYGSTVAEVLEDLRIDPEETRFLARLREELQIPEWKAEQRIGEDDGLEAPTLDQAVEVQPSGGLLQELADVSISQYLKILLPLTLVFLVVFYLEYQAEVGAERARLLTQETSLIQNAVLLVERELEIAAGDLYFVGDLVAEVADDEAPGRLAALERSLLAFVRRRPGYQQIRFAFASRTRPTGRGSHPRASSGTRRAAAISPTPCASSRAGCSFRPHSRTSSAASSQGCASRESVWRRRSMTLRDSGGESSS